MLLSCASRAIQATRVLVAVTATGMAGVPPALLLCLRVAKAQDFAVEAVEMTPAEIESARGSTRISPETTKELPEQPADRGALMALHMASVLNWLCSDTTVLTKTGLSTSGCYRAIWPVTSSCAEEFQAKAPAAQNRVFGERQGIVSFRTSLRECLARRYGERVRARTGVTAVSIAAGQPDPLAARMGGDVSRVEGEADVPLGPD